jgi:DNA-binding beta-propeller fold protein YncE
MRPGAERARLHRPRDGLDRGASRVPGIERPSGFLLDAANRRAYVTGEGNARVGVLDLETGRVVGSYPVGEDPDVLALDAERHHLFVAAESGVIAPFEIRGDSLIPLPRYRAPHAHSIASDPATHLLYVPLEDVGGRPTLRILAFEP